MPKQTAVDWLIQQLIEKGHNIPMIYFEQAKEMERKQIIEAYTEGDTFPQSYLHGEDYYKQNYDQVPDVRKMV